MKKIKLGFILVLTITLFSCRPERTFDEEQILNLTENAYLEGYKAALLNQDVDSTWNEVSKKYLFKNN